MEDPIANLTAPTVTGNTFTHEHGASIGTHCHGVSSGSVSQANTGYHTHAVTAVPQNVAASDSQHSHSLSGPTSAASAGSINIGQQGSQAAYAHQSSVDTALATIAAKVNEILNCLRTAGIMEEGEEE